MSLHVLTDGIDPDSLDTIEEFLKRDLSEKYVIEYIR